MLPKHKNLKKLGQSKNLKQYYADDMAEDVDNRKLNKTRNNVMKDHLDTDAEDDKQNAEVDPETLKKGNMDRISDFLVSMIFKNVLFMLNLLINIILEGKHQKCL